MAKLSSVRARKMRAQNGLCYYCEAPMWSWHPDKFCARHGVTKRSVHHYRCTAEHLTARCDGGTDHPDNIVAACHYCNNRRHAWKRPPDAAFYRDRVRARVARGTYRTVLTKKHKARARAAAKRRARARAKAKG